MNADQPPTGGPPRDPIEGRESEQAGNQSHEGSQRHPEAERIHFTVGPKGQRVAYRPNEVLTTGGEDALRVGRGFFNDERLYSNEVIGPFTRLLGVPDPLLLVEELRLNGFRAQPNYVYFSHSMSANPVYPSPVYPSPVYPSPVYPSPVYPSPFVPGPFDQIPPSGELPRQSSCRAITPGTDTEDLFEQIHTAPDSNSPDVIVLDTGLAEAAFLPVALQAGGIKAAKIPDDTDQPDWDMNGFLDPVAGHGTFIAGVIGQIAPGCKITLYRVLKTVGVTDELTIVRCLKGLATTLSQPARTLLNLSFGGEVLDDPWAMAWAIRTLQLAGVTVVASAGNDATWRHQYPAALRGVIAVGAVGPTGPAWFTNYGPWVDACAPGVDLVSTFFTGWNGDLPKGADGLDPDEYHGWARWSGTSFSGPVVVGNLARLMMAGATAQEAIERMIMGESLTRAPYLGTIIDAL